MITRLFILAAASLLFIATPAAAQPPDQITSFVTPSGKTVFRQGNTYFVDACGKPGRPGELRCFAKVVTNAKGEPLATSGTINGLKAGDLRGAYGQTLALPPASSKVVAIIIPYDYPKLESNLATYRTAMSLGTCSAQNGCFTRVYQDGVKPPSPPAGSNWGIEASLDTQMVSAMCPECKIRVYEAKAADSLNLSKMVEQANNDANPPPPPSGGTQVPAIPIVAASNSYGNTEATWFADTSIGNDAARFQSANFPIVFASGDTGYGVNCPACLNTVLAVGGTTLKKNSSNVWTETAWAKAGSGCDSKTYDPYLRPSWNITSMPPTTDFSCNTQRMVADVAAVADPATGVAVYGPCGFGGLLFGTTSWCVVGGTSASAPIWAGIIGSRGLPLDPSTPNIPQGATIYPPECPATIQNRLGCYLYFSTATKLGTAYNYSAASGRFNDVALGSNGSCSGSILCTALTGYDGPTGLGTPKAALKP